MSSSTLTYSSTRPPLSTPGTTPAPSHHPTPRNSSPPPIPLPGCGPDGCRSVDDGPGTEEHQLRRAEAQHVAYHVHPLSHYLSNLFTTERCTNPIQCPMAHVMKRTSSGGSSVYQWWSRNDDVYRDRGYLWMMTRRAMVHRRTREPSWDRGCARVW